MSKHINHHKTHASIEAHGSVSSYVIGFILSLIFSIIPYYLVVEKIVTGTTLLATILVFAIIQMFIQIIFFLHLGRGPKPLYNIAFFGGTVGIIFVVVFGSIFIMNHLHYNMEPDEVTKKLAQKEGLDQVGGQKTGACQDLGVNHKVIIRNSILTPSKIDASLCDTLTFINEDKNEREFTFGTYPNYGTYAGEWKLLAKQGRGKSVTLNQTGEYQFYDYLEPAVAGSLKVTE